MPSMPSRPPSHHPSRPCWHPFVSRLLSQPPSSIWNLLAWLHSLPVHPSPPSPPPSSLCQDLGSTNSSSPSHQTSPLTFYNHRTCRLCFASGPRPRQALQSLCPQSRSVV